MRGHVNGPFSLGVISPDGDVFARVVGDEAYPGGVDGFGVAGFVFHEGADFPFRVVKVAFGEEFEFFFDPFHFVIVICMYVICSLCEL